MILIFAVLNDALIEYIVGGVLILRPYLPLLGLLSAMFLVFTFQVNILRLFLGVETDPFWDFFLTSFIIARLSYVINGLFGKI